jgi:hypothetical protein
MFVVKLERREREPSAMLRLLCSFCATSPIGFVPDQLVEERPCRAKNLRGGNRIRSAAQSWRSTNSMR